VCKHVVAGFYLILSSFVFCVCFSNRLLLCVNVDLHVFNFVDIHAITVAIPDDLSRDEMSKCLTVA